MIMLTGLLLRLLRDEQSIYPSNSRPGTRTMGKRRSFSVKWAAIDSVFISGADEVAGNAPKMEVDWWT